MDLKFRRVWLLLPLIALTIGCGGGEATLPVSGTVTLDGKPLPNVNVMMIGTDGASTMATTDTSGSFSTGVQENTVGVPAGTYNVGITAKTEPISSDLAGQVKATPAPFAPKYMSADTSGLKIVVAEGMKPVELTLTGK